MELTTQLIITIYAIRNMMRLKTRNQVCDKTMLDEISGLGNRTLRTKIDKSIVGKLINTKVNFGLGAPIKAKKSSNLLMNLQKNSINQSLENLIERESQH